MSVERTSRPAEERMWLDITIAFCLSASRLPTSLLRIPSGCQQTPRESNRSTLSLAISLGGQ